MTTTSQVDNDAHITVANYRMDERLNQGRIVHLAKYPIAEREGLIREALGYGYDIQFVQSKHVDRSHLLWFSTNGFKQR